VISNIEGTSSIENSDRVFMYCKNIDIQGLANIQYKTFFHLCRMESISFDLENKIGSAFLFGDSLQSGVISIITIDDENSKVVKTLLDCLLFLERQTGFNSAKSKSDFHNDHVGFPEILSRIKILNKSLAKPREKLKEDRSEFLKIPSLEK